MTEFSDIDAAMRMRALIASIVEEELNQLRPADRFGTVKSIDDLQKTAEVIFDGETDPIVVRFDPVNKPTSTIDVMIGTSADRVRITGKAGNYWITQIISGTPSVLPPGVTVPFSGPSTSIPAGWLLCDGSELLITSYPSLYNTLTTNGTVFPHGTNTNGSGGAGTTHFKIPDLRGQGIAGVHPSIPEFNVLGEKSGNMIQLLTEANLPAHAHAIDHNHASFNTGAGGGTHTHDANFSTTDGTGTPNPAIVDVGGSAGSYAATISGTGGTGDHVHAIDVPNHVDSSGLTGGDTTFSILQPTTALNFIIKF